MRIYINGSLDKTQSWSSGGYGLTSWNNPVGVGASIWNGSNNPTNFFDGEIGVTFVFGIQKELKVKLIQIKTPLLVQILT